MPSMMPVDSRACRGRAIAISGTIEDAQARQTGLAHAYQKGTQADQKPSH